MENQNLNQNEKPKKKFNFKKYLEENPEYKAKHYAYITERLECTCGRFCARSNISNHRKSKLHFELLELKNKINNKNTI